MDRRDAKYCASCNFYFCRVIIPIADLQIFKAKALQWASSFNVFCCLDSNNFKDQYSKFDVLIAVGVKDEIIAEAENAFDKLEQFRKKRPGGWMTGFFGYDLKNEIEEFIIRQPRPSALSRLVFFCPAIPYPYQRQNEIEIIADDPQHVFESIERQAIYPAKRSLAVNIQSRLSKPRIFKHGRKNKRTH